MDKRGLSQVFKYILVLIAGVVILAFFINFGGRQIILREELDSAIFSRLLNSNFNSFSISINADKTIDMGSESVINFNKFNCGAVGVNNRQPVRNDNIIFAPNEIQDDKLNLWTARWKMPFSVTNFFYVLGDNTNIVIEGNNPFAVSLRNQNGVEFIPSRFRDNSGSIRTVYISNTPNFQRSSLADNEVEIYNYKECDELKDNYLCRGRLRIKDKSGATRNTIFLGKEMMYAAIFSDSFEDYQCGVDRAFKRLEILIDLYDRKANELTGPGCNNAVALLQGSLRSSKVGLNLNLNPDSKISQVKNLVSANKDVRSKCGNYAF